MESGSSLFGWLVYAHLFFYIGPGAIIGAYQVWRYYRLNHIAEARFPRGFRPHNPTPAF